MSAASTARRRALGSLASEHPVFYRALYRQALLGTSNADQARRTALTQLAHLFPGRSCELYEQERAAGRGCGSQDGGTPGVPRPGRGSVPGSPPDAGVGISLAFLQNRYRRWRIRVRDSGQWVAVRPGIILTADSDDDLGRQLADCGTARSPTPQRSRAGARSAEAGVSRDPGRRGAGPDLSRTAAPGP